MRSFLGEITKRVPSDVLAVLVVGGLVAVATLFSAVVPRVAPADTGSATAPEPLASITRASPSPITTPDQLRSRPLPTADRVPVALGAVPEAGGIIFGSYGIWRYDGASGNVDRLGDSGHLAADGRGYVVRAEGGPYRYVDAATGVERVIAPADATDADAVPAGAKGVTGAYVLGGKLFAFSPDGDTSLLMEGPDIASVRADPTGTFLVVNVSAGPRAGSELRVRDLSTGVQRVVATVSPPASDDQATAFRVGSWSPDGRYLAYFGISISNSVNADGVHLSVVDVTTSARTDLGTTIGGASRLDWAAPHTLAYTVAGGGRFTWERQHLRTWSPEAGVRAVTGPEDIGLNPSWSANGDTLYFITATSTAAYVPMAFFAGRDSGARGVVSVDIRTMAMERLTAPGKYIDEGVRASTEEDALLVVRRTAQVAASLDALPPVRLELALLDPRTQRERPLVRIAGDVGFGYYGGYGGPEGMAWSR